MSDIFTKRRGATFARRCKHFDGIDRTDPAKTCKAGILMRMIVIDTPYSYRHEGSKAVYSSSFSMPCFRDSDPLGVCNCEHQEFPSEAEIEQDGKEIDKLIKQTITARCAILEDAGGKRSVSGKINCPVCTEGKLRYHIAENGHVHASCTSDECVAWME